MNNAYYEPRHIVENSNDISSLLIGAVSIIFIAGVIFLLVILIGKYAHSQGWVGTNSDKQDSLEIVKERYAKGEISEEEFNKIKKNLSLPNITKS